MSSPDEPLTPPEPPTSPTGLPQSGWQQPSPPQGPPPPPPSPFQQPPQYQQQPYQQQPYQQQYPGQPVVTRGTNGKATAALVLGICGLLVCPLVCSIIALILGYQARNEIDRSAGMQDGRGSAMAGIVLGWIGVGLTAVFVILIVIVAATDPSAFEEASAARALLA